MGIIVSRKHIYAQYIYKKYLLMLGWYLGGICKQKHVCVLLFLLTTQRFTVLI